MKRQLLIAATALSLTVPAVSFAQPYGNAHGYDNRYEERQDKIERKAAKAQRKADRLRNRAERRAYLQQNYGYRGERQGYYYAPSRGYYQVSPQYYNRGWTQGQYLPRNLMRYPIRDWHRYGLMAPADRNNAWFFVGNDAVMANIHNGLIATVTYDFF